MDTNFSAYKTVSERRYREIAPVTLKYEEVTNP